MARNMCTSSCRAFSLIDLLFIILIAVFLVACLLPSIRRTHESAHRVNCGSHLRQIGQAMVEYANANGGNFPRTRYDPNDATVRAYTGVAATQPFAADGPQANDVTAALYLLLRTQDIISAVFVCPGTRAVKPWDFGGAGTL